MINLGDVNFALGADTQRLHSSMRAMQRFGYEVDRVSSLIDKDSVKTAAAYRRQEKATVSALNQVLNLNQRLRSAKGGEEFAQRTTAAFRTLNSEMTRGKISALDFHRAMLQFKTSIANVNREFKDSGGARNWVGALENLSSSAVLLAGPLSGIAVRISAITAVMKRGGFAVAAFIAGVATAGVAMGSFALQLLDAGKQMNAFNAIFTAVTGNVYAAAIELGDAFKIARDAGTRIQETAVGLARFEAAAEGTSLAGNKAKQMFRDVAKSAAVMQLPAEQTLGVFRALEQIMSKGTVQAEELRGQLGDRLPGAFQIASRAMGVSTAKLNDMMKKGQVLSEDFLPKFVAELKRTFGISTAPIDNYTARLNNMQTAWFQLREELDKQIGVTQRVMDFYQKVTQTLDWVRENLNRVKIYASAAGGAMLGLVAPTILGGLVTLAANLVKVAASLDLINKALLAFPGGRLISWGLRLAIVLAGAIAALYKYSDQIRIVHGEMGRLSDYANIIWGDIKVATSDATQFIKNQFPLIKQAWQELLDTMDINWSSFWDTSLSDFKNDLNTIINDLVNFTKAVPNILGVIANALKRPFMDADMADILHRSLTNKIAKQFSSSSVDYVGRGIAATREYANSARIRANQRALARQNELFKQAQQEGLGVDTSSIRQLPPVNVLGGDNDTLSNKQIRHLEKQRDAILRINQAIERTHEEVDALKGSDQTVNTLTEAFKREDEVMKYARALQKAGVNADFIKLKVRELYDLLEQRDALDKAREALTTFRDSLASAFDNIGNSVLDSIFEGKDALKSLADVAKNTAKEILKTYFQLAVTNPLKNALFGMDEPTLKGGFFGNIKKLLNIGQTNQQATGESVTNHVMSRLNAMADATHQTDVELTKLGSATGALGTTFGSLGKGLTGFSSSLMTAAQKMLAGGGGAGNWLGGLMKAFGSLGGALGHMMSISPGATSFLMGGGVGLFAKGATFQGGRATNAYRPLKRFAKGSVMSSATQFPMAGGNTGIMSELNQEAIMPLGRDSAGNLGVKQIGSNTSVIEVKLSPELVGMILQEAKNQALTITSGGIDEFRNSKDFKNRVTDSVRKIRKGK